MAITEQKLIQAIERGVVKNCANYDDGMCLLKDKPCVWKEEEVNPDTEKPYPFGDKGITCPYLRKAVLPGNKNVEKMYYAFLDDYDGRVDLDVVADTCERCKTPIIKASNRQKYCAGCRDMMNQKKNTTYVRKMRAGLL